MLLVYVPAFRSYLNLRKTFGEVRRELDRHLDVRRFELVMAQRSAALLDAVVLGDHDQPAPELTSALPAVAGDAETPSSKAIRRVDDRLLEAGRRALELARDGQREEAARQLAAAARIRDEELLPLVDAPLAGQDAKLEDRLLAISGQLLLVPFLELEASARRLRSHVAETIAAAAFLQHTQRMTAEVQDFAFLGGARHKLDLARDQAKKSYERWHAHLAGADFPLPIRERVREIGESYRELHRRADRLVARSEESSRAEAAALYASQLRPLVGATPGPVIGAFDAYRDSLAASARSVARRIDLAGYVLGFFALVVVALAFGSPLLMSRWIVRPIGSLTRATRRLGSGDLSEQVQIQSADELGELAACFNKMVVELSQAQEQLGRRERLVVLGQLAGSVAHEIRNPLGVMKNSIYFLRLTQKLKDPKALQHLGLIEDEINRANRIIVELLDYARDPTSQIESFDLQDAFYKALALVEMPESVHLEHDFADEPLKVSADAGQIERILANLLRNAVQAMPDGGLLTLACRRDGDEIHAVVLDTGVGIAEENLDKVFEPLYTDKAKGIGLGLPLSQRYAQLNGGRIECESRAGEGATFRLVLPAPRDEPSDATGKNSLAVQESRGPATARMNHPPAHKH